MVGESIQNSINAFRNALINQFDISWQLLEFHIASIEDEECLWRPSSKGLHVVNEQGTWHADWPDSESYDIGPPSIAWLTWHITFWWSMVIDCSFESGTLKREDVLWPGSICAVREKMIQMHDKWRSILATLPDEEFIFCKRTKWPFEDKPFFDLAAWLNLELMKNAAEIGYCRFLYASRK